MHATYAIAIYMSGRICLAYQMCKVPQKVDFTHCAVFDMTWRRLVAPRRILVADVYYYECAEPPFHLPSYHIMHIGSKLVVPVCILLDWLTRSRILSRLRRLSHHISWSFPLPPFEARSAPRPSCLLHHFLLLSSLILDYVLSTSLLVPSCISPLVCHRSPISSLMLFSFFTSSYLSSPCHLISHMYVSLSSYLSPRNSLVVYLPSHLSPHNSLMFNTRFCTLAYLFFSFLATFLSHCLATMEEDGEHQQRLYERMK